jgi:hypothetical protein
MNTHTRFAVLFGLALASVQAQAVDFSFTSGTFPGQANANAYTASDAATGLSVTATAWADTKAFNNRPNEFATAALTFTPGVGLGVCNASEGFKCTPSGFADALGNQAANDLILFTFSQSVRLESLTLQQFGSNSNLSLWAGTGAFSPKKQTVAALGPENLVATTASFVNDVRTVSLAANTAAYDWIAVAAKIGQIDDFAKLQSLLVQPVAQPVPEPDTWIMLLAGLGLVAFAVSRRTQA